MLEEHECMCRIKGLQDPYSIWEKKYMEEKSRNNFLSYM